MQLPEGFGGETAVFPITFTDHRQCRRLDTSHRVGSASGCDGQCLRSVYPHQPVGFTSGFGGMVKVVILASVFKMFQSLTDSLVRQAAYPQTHERDRTADIMIEVSEYQLTLAAGIGRHNNLLAVLEQSGNDFYLGDHAAVRLVSFFRPYLSGNKREGFGNDGQIAAYKAVQVVFFRHGGLDKMSECPCHIITVSGQITFLSLAGTHDAGDFTCHTGLFCYDCFHTDLF